MRRRARHRSAFVAGIEIEVECLVASFEIAQVRSSGEIVIRKIDSAASSKSVMVTPHSRQTMVVA